MNCVHTFGYPCRRVGRVDIQQQRREVSHIGRCRPNVRTRSVSAHAHLQPIRERRRVHRPRVEGHRRPVLQRHRRGQQPVADRVGPCRVVEVGSYIGGRRSPTAPGTPCHCPGTNWLSPLPRCGWSAPSLAPGNVVMSSNPCAQRRTRRRCCRRRCSTSRSRLLLASGDGVPATATAVHVKHDVHVRESKRRCRRRRCYSTRRRTQVTRPCLR